MPRIVYQGGKINYQHRKDQSRILFAANIICINVANRVALRRQKSFHAFD